MAQNGYLLAGRLGSDTDRRSPDLGSSRFSCNNIR